MIFVEEGRRQIVQVVVLGAQVKTETEGLVAGVYRFGAFLVEQQLGKGQGLPHVLLDMVDESSAGILVNLEITGGRSFGVQRRIDAAEAVVLTRRSRACGSAGQAFSVYRYLSVHVGIDAAFPDIVIDRVLREADLGGLARLQHVHAFVRRAAQRKAGIIINSPVRILVNDFDIWVFRD